MTINFLYCKQTLSASGENDPESIILMTPAKDVVIADKGEEVDFEGLALRNYQAPNHPRK